MPGTCFLWVPATYREPLRPFKALPLQELCFPQPRPALPGHLRSYRLMRQTFCLFRSKLSPETKVFAGCCKPLPASALSRRYLRESFSTCLDPYPGGSCGALIRFFPQDIGLPDVSIRSAPYKYPYCNFCTVGLSRLQSFSNVQARRFACCPPVAPTAECVICRSSSVLP
jgi:hypothetical protein